MGLQVSRSLHILFLLLILVSLLYFLSMQKDTLLLLKGIRVEGLYILIAISPLFLLSNALILRSLLRLFNVKLILRECLGICSVTAVGNLLTAFGGGTITKAIYLERRHAFQYTAFLSSMSAVYLLDLLLVGFLGGAIIAFNGFLDSEKSLTVFGGFLCMGVASITLLLTPIRLKEGNGWIADKLSNLFSGWKTIKGDSKLMVKIGLLLLLNNILAALELIAGYYSFSTVVEFPTALLIGMVTGLLNVVKLTPANLGVQEAVIAFSSTLMGIGFGEGLLAAALIRIVSMATVFVYAGIFGGYFVLSRYSKSKND